MRKTAAILIWATWAAGLSAMGISPRPMNLELRKASVDWLKGETNAAAAALEPLAWQDAAAAREWAAFLFLQQRYSDLEEFFRLSPSAKIRDDEALLWLARAQLNQSHFSNAMQTLRALSQTAHPLALAVRAEAVDGAGSPWPGAWPAALQACAGTRWEAATALAAGGSAAAAGKADEAEQLYKRAEKADRSFPQIHARLAGLYAGQGRNKDERIRLERALAVDSEDQASRTRLNSLLAAHPAMQVALDKEAAKAVERFDERNSPVVAALPALEGEPLVRVGLLESAPRFRLKLGGPTLVEGESRTLPAHSVWSAELAPGGGWQLRALSPTGEAPVRFAHPLRLKPWDEGSTFGLFDVAHGVGYYWSTKEDRYYRGLLELRPQGAQGLTLVNELGLDAYLLSVVPSEAPAYWPAAALQAQAVAARTDAWRSLGRFRPKGYDLCPTVQCAVYSGVGQEDARSTAAVLETRGRVLETESGRLHATFYMQHSGGHTQEPGEAWVGSGRNPPMAGIDALDGSNVSALFPLTPARLLRYLDDPEQDLQVWSNRGNGFRWTLRLNAEELNQWAGRRHKVGPLSGVQPVERSPSGYVRSAVFHGAEGDSIGSSDYLRSALKGIRSNLFYVESRHDAAGRLQAVLIHGGGWGHGVGMAQSGAKAQADYGRDAAAILKSYFPHSELTRRYPEP